MTSKFNDTLEMIESFSIEEQEEILEIEKKRILEKKRKLLLQDILEAEKDIENGDFTSGTPEELVKAIEKETELIKKKKV
ncbi:MAG TPA: hypothetical protein VJ455_10300 [Ignavibacteria bacterium]|nr:hypothetical protein [Ignavibacteria bacterium]